jgi:hypothetical protein
MKAGNPNRNTSGLKPGGWTTETARAAGKKSAAIRAAEKKLQQQDPLHAVKKALPSAFEDLLKAAKGEGAWKELSARERLQALLKVIEYGVGRSISLDKMTPKDVESEGGGVEEPSSLQFE